MGRPCGVPPIANFAARRAVHRGANLKRLVVQLATLLVAAAACTAVRAESDWVLVIHGGAGVIERSDMTAEREQSVRAALQRSLQRGADVLEHGGAGPESGEPAGPRLGG